MRNNKETISLFHQCKPSNHKNISKCWLTNSSRLQILQNKEERGHFWPLALPSVNTSQCLLILTSESAKGGQLQTLESSSRGSHLIGFHWTRHSKMRASSKLQNWTRGWNTGHKLLLLLYFNWWLLVTQTWKEPADREPSEGNFKTKSTNFSSYFCGKLIK